MGVTRDGIPGQLLIIPDVSIIVFYILKDEVIHILRVLHHKQIFPAGDWNLRAIHASIIPRNFSIAIQS
jgi:plasmid stabilization system protein ParE